MDIADVRFLFGYDRWATEKVLAVCPGMDEAAWGATRVVEDRGLGLILVHALGAHQRWRRAFMEEGEGPFPEDEPLLSPDALAAAWAAEFVAFDAFVAEITPGFLAYLHDGVPVARMLQHLANHGTQHRSEAAVLLTQAGRSPGQLDMIDYAEDVAAGRIPDPALVEGA